MSQPLEIRYSPAFDFDFECKASSQGTVEGIASVFNGPPDSHGDVVAAGAFHKSLSSHAKAKTSPAMLWSHDQSRPVGKWIKLSETQNGLEVKGQVNLKTAAGRDAFEHLRAGDMTGLSIGFNIPSGGASYEGNKRIVREIELHEISLVALPSQNLARVKEVRSLQSRAEFRDLLRNQGFPRRAAEKLATGGWPALAGENCEELEIRHLAEQVRDLAARLKS
ncbi:MAG: HK97 family phage prohead protease [Pseudomonadota bacterium]